MKHLSETEACRKLSAFCETLSHYNVRSKYDITLGLYADETTNSPECSHHFSGHKRQGILPCLALFGMVAVTVALIRGICSMVNR